MTLVEDLKLQYLAFLKGKTNIKLMIRTVNTCSMTLKIETQYQIKNRTKSRSFEKNLIKSKYINTRKLLD